MVNWTWNNENENQAHKLILIIWLNGNDLAAGMLENVYHSWKCVRVPRVAHFQSRLIVSITIIVIRELMTTQHTHTLTSAGTRNENAQFLRIWHFNRNKWRDMLQCDATLNHQLLLKWMNRKLQIELRLEAISLQTIIVQTAIFRFLFLLLSSSFVRCFWFVFVIIRKKNAII